MIQLYISAIWLGILTSISPCPLSTNIVAVSYISKNFSKTITCVINSIFYTLGRCLTYALLGFLLSRSLDNIPMISDFLQTKATYFIGPLLIFLGIVLLDVIHIDMPQISISNAFVNKIVKLKALSSFFIGLMFALMFCPVSAAFFFSNLIQSKGNLIVLLCYGIGTGIPVLFFSFLLAFGMNKISQAFNKTTQFEKYARNITAIIFIFVGIYYLIRSLI